VPPIESLDIPCEHCGQKTPVSLGEIRNKGQLTVTCAHCGRTFTLDATEAKATLDDLDKAFRNLPDWIKVRRDF
jgi:uncharacterized Zn finger protein